MAMTPDELKTANDFETGWAEERLDAAEFHWGTGITDILPHALSEQITARADRDGISALELIRIAVTDYLNNDKHAA